MKRLILLLLTFHTYAFSQPLPGKPVIDSSAIVNWPALGAELAITGNGKYFVYSISNKPTNSSTLIVQSTNGPWKKEIPNAAQPFFSGNNKLLVYNIKDTLCFLQLATGKTEYIPGINTVKHPVAGNAQWLAYCRKDTLTLHNLFTGKRSRFNNVTDYTFDKKGNVLLLRTKATLQWLRLPEGIPVTIWSAQDTSAVIKSYAVDTAGSRLAFIAEENGINTLWYYRSGMSKAVIKASNTSPGIEAGLTIGNTFLTISKNGRYLLFQLKPTTTKPEIKDAVSLDIWSYRDPVLQCTQLSNPVPQTYMAAINTDSSRIIRLEQENEKLLTWDITGNHAVLQYDTIGDRFWLNDQMSYRLLSLQTGIRKPLPVTGYTEFYLSPTGKYLVYYNAQKQNSYYSYNLITDSITKISGQGNSWAYKNEFIKNDSPFVSLGIAGWLEKDAGLLVYDNYDIWLFDAAGTRPPLNITNAYGSAHHIKLRLVNELDEFYQLAIHPANEISLLTAFNTANKYNGFFRKALNSSSDPELLTMGPWTFFYYLGDKQVQADHAYSFGMPPLKAKNAGAWIIKRQSATQAPNYLLTKDFKHYRQLTNLQPQNNYNWLTAELLTWQQLDGTTSQGILYKPENFDPHKKYPVLFNYYEQMSGRLYQYPIPDFTRNNINIPWFVSRGYLVFTPDIYYTKGHPGQSTYNTLVSAALHLAEMPFVNAKRMGINGHSTAGFETNYLVTHTGIFAAAIEGAGTSNWISSALQLSGPQGTAQISRLGLYESILGASLWERPDLYLENSPVLQADKVTTPLIIFHSKIDTAVPWEQAVELFISLRRLNKPVWMLQYDNSNHGAWGNDCMDFTIRITQFLDHYLKGAPPPVWMTRGIPAKLKGIETGYRLDTRGN
ncbi:Dipeptidyl aminopeptidase/acylaminoacyl peptidase [Chitinophaga rupis]|uniref:Dipeptidyl aminopeptidase/acylaminoacyl peptidase n=1 Tax=Chitinophaga rupis TaxID=573321 RepID=A0A1H7RQX9_9BACT|nr:prolyl oligopeptidase family serine peptidase [Chitinophaga rupis]SEL62244.1 Dipeptidyl aminopeptidase/acylaminoacyl peptidase [Chitinophaga rupis]